MLAVPELEEQEWPDDESDRDLGPGGADRTTSAPGGGAFGASLRLRINSADVAGGGGGDSTRENQAARMSPQISVAQPQSDLDHEGERLRGVSEEIFAQE